MAASGFLSAPGISIGCRVGILVPAQPDAPDTMPLDIADLDPPGPDVDLRPDVGQRLQTVDDQATQAV